MMDAIDLLDKRLNQAIGMIACLVNNDQLCKLNSQLVCNALWGIEDMLHDIRETQQQIYHNENADK